jgi:hypothetical protein
MIKRSVTNKSKSLGSRIAMIIFALTILTLTVTTGTVYADLSGWDGKWFEVAVKHVAVCYDPDADKFKEENGIETAYIHFWWGDRNDGSGIHLQADLYYLVDGDWTQTKLNFGRKSGRDTNDRQFLFGLSKTGLDVGAGNTTVSFYCTAIMQTPIKGTLKGAYFLPLGGVFSFDTNTDGCAGQFTLAGKIIDESKVPADIR